VIWKCSGAVAPRKPSMKASVVDWSDAVPVLEDPRAITITDYESGPEERFIMLGLDALARVLVVVYAWRAAISG